MNIKNNDYPHLGTRVEIKNLNSFKDVEDSIIYEIARQIRILSSGGKVDQETRSWSRTKKLIKEGKL